jgi:predicted site-specific integrase-resolvase
MENNILSPYKAAGVVNTWLKEDGIEKKLPPQMMYGYVKKGYIVGTQTEDGKVCVMTEDLKAWYDKYTKKTTSTSEVVSEDGTVGEW